jgi:hypothetical protein
MVTIIPMAMTMAINIILIVGQPPAGNSCSKSVEQSFIGDVRAFSRFDDQYGTFAPFGVRPTHHRDQRHLRQRAHEGLDFTGIDPFTARFDEVFCPSSNADITLLVDDGEVSGVEPTPEAGEGYAGSSSGGCR